MVAINTTGFQSRTLDKVERLLDLLDEMQRHPNLKGKFAMHGGTAINLFMLDVLRLSVDIDISYIGALPRETMLLNGSSIATIAKTETISLNTVRAHVSHIHQKTNAHTQQELCELIRSIEV